MISVPVPIPQPLPILVPISHSYRPQRCSVGSSRPPRRHFSSSFPLRRLHCKGTWELRTEYSAASSTNHTLLRSGHGPTQTRSRPHSVTSLPSRHLPSRPYPLTPTKPSSPLLPAIPHYGTSRYLLRSCTSTDNINFISTLSVVFVALTTSDRKRDYSVLESLGPLRRAHEPALSASHSYSLSRSVSAR